MIILLLGFMELFSSCRETTKGHTTVETIEHQIISTGEAVPELGQNIMVIYQDKKSNYWFGSWRDGLYKYDGKSIIHYSASGGLPANRVEEIKEDRQGNIYINTTKGLFRYNGIGFTKIAETRSSESEWKLEKDDLWFKCLEEQGYIFRFDGKNLHKLKFPTSSIGEAYIAKHPHYLDPYAVYCIYKDRKQNIWFGTSVLGVCRFNGKTFDWITEQDLTEMHDGPANGVRSITEDKDGDFWFNTEYKYRVYREETNTKTNNKRIPFYDRIKSIGCLDGKMNGDLNEYLSILKDDHNHLWMAIYLQGVWQFDGEKITHYPIKVDGKNIPIYCLFKDHQGSIWLGTEENGAYKFNGQTFEKFALR